MINLLKLISIGNNLYSTCEFMANDYSKADDEVC